MMKKILLSLIFTTLISSVSSVALAAPTGSAFQGNGLGDAPTTLQATINPTSNSVSFASSACQVPTDITSLFNYALCVLDSGVVPFLIGMALILFLAGVLRFVSSGDNEEARQGGRNMMLFGIVALFVMVSIWGFVNILSKSFFGTDSTIQSLPRKSTTLFKQ